MPRRRMSTIERGAKLAIGYEIGRGIISTFYSVCRFSMKIIVLFCMWWIGKEMAAQPNAEPALQQAERMKQEYRQNNASR